MVKPPSVVDNVRGPDVGWVQVDLSQAMVLLRVPAQSGVGPEESVPSVDVHTACKCKLALSSKIYCLFENLFAE